MQDPSMLIDDSEVSGTCFRVDASTFLSHVPFYDIEKMYFVTNFHVIDEADERVVYLRTAGMGKNMATAKVEAVVPSLDVAVLSVDLGGEHERWFDGNIQETLSSVLRVEMNEERINTKMQRVRTVGFPQGLEEVLSSGWLSGRGSDDADLLQLNISINSGNSGGPLVGEHGKVIGVCTATLDESEAIAFAVPIFSVLSYFRKFYKEPFGRFPRWGMTLLPMTEAFANARHLHSIGAVVNEVEPGSCLQGKLKSGDVIHSINGNALDRFGLLQDSTRGSKITPDNSEFILTCENAVFDVTSNKIRRSFTITPEPIVYKVLDSWRAWNPPAYTKFGPFIFQSLTKDLLTYEEVAPDQLVTLVEEVRRSKSMKEIVVISKIDQTSHVARYGYPREFDMVLKVGRSTVKDMAHLVRLLENMRTSWEAGTQKYVKIKTSSGTMEFCLDFLYTRKRKRSM